MDFGPIRVRKKPREVPFYPVGGLRKYVADEGANILQVPQEADVIFLSLEQIPGFMQAGTNKFIKHKLQKEQL